MRSSQLLKPSNGKRSSFQPGAVHRIGPGANDCPHLRGARVNRQNKLTSIAALVDASTKMTAVGFEPTPLRTGA